jgi:hypothetical protein
MRSVILLNLIAAAVLAASEHHGLATFHGLPVPGAVVTATHGDSKFTTSTDDDGSYSFPDLADGTWTIDVQITGFTKATREIGVAAGAPAAIWDLQLALPPSAPKTAAVAPPGGRGGPQTTPEQAQAAARQRAAAQTRTQDQNQSRAAALAATGGGGGGGDAVLSGSVGGAGAGISAGNAVAGSQYNGNASFSLDNSVWDAIPYSLTGIRTPKAAFAKGRVGISFGGPLRIPHLFNSKSGTFTVSYNMGRTRNATTSSSTVPTAFERMGDFSKSSIAGSGLVYDPTTGQPFPNNKIPLDRLNGAALVLANYYPLPNSPDVRLNYQTALVGISDQDSLNVRLNQTLGKKDRLSGGVGWNRSSGANPNFLGFLDNTSGYQVSTNDNWSHTYSKRLIQNIGVNFSRSRNQLLPFFASLNHDVARDLGILGTSSLPLDWGPPNLNFTNFNGLSDGVASLSRNQNSGFNYSLSFNRGKHQWNFGTGYSRQQLNPLSDPDGRGSFTFTGSAPGDTVATGYDFADFLLNRPAAASIRFGNADKYLRNSRLSFYAQDNWTISTVLSANAGIRWDYTAPFTERYNRLANLDIAPAFANAAVVLAGRPGAYSGSLPLSLVRKEYDGFSPSVGLAWRLFPKNTKTPTVLRVSFNRSRTLDGYTAIANNLSGQPPFAKVLSIPSSASNPLTMQSAFLNTPVTSNTYAVDPNYRMIALNQATLMLTHSFQKGYYLTAGLFYIHASHLDQTSLPNSLAPGLPVPVNGPLSGYTYEQSNGSLRAMQNYYQFGRNMANGFSAGVNAQFARATDNGALGAIFGSGTVAQNWRDLDAERATSSLLGRGNVSANWQYSTGQGKAGGTLLKGWRGAAFKDWTFTNSVYWRAGLPLTAAVAGALAGGTGVAGTLRADATGRNIAAPRGSGEPFNLAAFAVPASGNWGSAGRGTIPGPSMWSLNGSLGRVFRLGERRSADLRFDATNILNHVVITRWSTTVNASNYGLPTGTQPMRSMTANLRVRF